MVKSLSHASKINEINETAKEGDEVVIARLHVSTHTSNGVLTLATLGEKNKSKSGHYDLVSHQCDQLVVYPAICII